MRYATIIVYLLMLLAVSAQGQLPIPKFHAESIVHKLNDNKVATVIDVDEDGYPDIIVASDKKIEWYRNPGNRGAHWDRFLIVQQTEPFGASRVCLAVGLIQKSIVLALGAGHEVRYFRRPLECHNLWTQIGSSQTLVLIRQMAFLAGSHVQPTLAILGKGGASHVGADVDWLELQCIPGKDTPNYGETVFCTRCHAACMDVFHAAIGNDVVLLTGLTAENIEQITTCGWYAAVSGWRFGALSAEPPYKLKQPVLDPILMKSTGLDLCTANSAADSDLNFYVVVGHDAGTHIRRVTIDRSATGWSSITAGDLLGLGVDYYDQIVASKKADTAEKGAVVLYASNAMRQPPKSEIPSRDKVRKWVIAEDADYWQLETRDMDADGRLDIIGLCDSNITIWWNDTK